MEYCCASCGPTPFSPSTEMFTKLLLKNLPTEVSLNVYCFSILQGPHQVAYISRKTSLFCFFACCKAAFQSCSINSMPAGAFSLAAVLVFAASVFAATVVFDFEETLHAAKIKTKNAKNNFKNRIAL